MTPGPMRRWWCARYLKPWRCWECRAMTVAELVEDLRRSATQREVRAVLLDWEADLAGDDPARWPEVVAYRLTAKIARQTAQEQRAEALRLEALLRDAA